MVISKFNWQQKLSKLFYRSRSYSVYSYEGRETGFTEILQNFFSKKAERITANV